MPLDLGVVRAGYVKRGREGHEASEGLTCGPDEVVSLCVAENRM
jgi:hypothetical protein